MEHAADSAEAAAVDRYFSSSTENIFVPVCLYGHRDDCFVMCPRSSVGGAIQMTLDSVTVILFTPEGRTSLHRSTNIISAGLMPTEARGNYLPEPPLLTRDKDLSQPATQVDTTCWQLFRPAINAAHF